MSACDAVLLRLAQRVPEKALRRLVEYLESGRPGEFTLHVGADGHVRAWRVVETGRED